jgi:glycosyltransferase involved in cell wall biosynthesis
MIDENSPLVSILCITFNHEKYIAQAIEGFLIQKTNFKFEIIIHDDASTDKNVDIIKSYQVKNPELFKCIFQAENQYSKKDGSLENAIFSAPRGKYIALCEGDDFWTDPYKLQKQVDFLENNEEYGLVHHEADYFFQKSGDSVKNHHQTNKIYPSNGFVFEELLSNNNIYTPTVMFKASLLKNFMAIDVNTRSKFLMGDYVLWLEFSQYCKFYYFSESMATYRVLENSASKTTSYGKDLSFLNSYFDIKLFFMNRYTSKSITHDIIEQARLSASLSSAIKYQKNKDARFFASKLKLNNWRVLFKRILVFTPTLFKHIQKKNML